MLSVLSTAMHAWSVYNFPTIAWYIVSFKVQGTYLPHKMNNFSYYTRRGIWQDTSLVYYIIFTHAFGSRENAA